MATQVAGGQSDGPRKAVHGFSGGVCEACGDPLPTNGRGQRRRFCDDACRAWWHSEARRRGAEAMRRVRRTPPAARPDPTAGLLPGTCLARSVRIGRPQPVADRQAAFLGVVRGLAGRLAMDPAAEAGRLAAVAADRVALAVPRDEYEAARRNTMQLLGVAG